MTLRMPAAALTELLRNGPNYERGNGERNERGFKPVKDGSR